MLSHSQGERVRVIETLFGSSFETQDFGEHARSIVTN
jgi:hypothetical protein